MDNTSMISLKVYMFQHDSEEPEIRRFGVDENVVKSFQFLSLRVLEVFPKLNGKVFRIYWTDDEGDQITISSDEELNVALNSMRAQNVKKFYVRVKALGHKSADREHSVVHVGVYCDGCEGSIAGFRYKCVVCKDYDLCETCEQTGIHDEHPMLKIPHMDHSNIRMLPQFLEPFMSFNVNETSKRHRRRHSHDGGHPDSCKKKKRSEKRETGHETGDESEEGCHKKHSHRKGRKSNKCLYSQLMNDVFGYFAPEGCNSNGNSAGRQGGEYSSHLRTIGTTLQKLLDPLGVDVEYEVLSKKDKKDNEKKEEKKQTDEKDEKQTPSVPQGKDLEVGFKAADGVKQRIEEITKMLASQSVSQATSVENDGWVSFEELKKDSDDPQPGSSGVSSAPQQEAKAPQKESQGKENLYPNLTVQHVPTNPKVRAALEKMLAMGFTNEGNWLSSLLEAKNGDIDQALEVLMPYKK